MNELYLYIMKILEVVFELFVLYLLYKLVFDFIIPVYKTTQQVKKQFGDMSSRMQDHMNRQAPPASTTINPTPDTKTASSKARKDDYIDFEEVK